MKKILLTGGSGFIGKNLKEGIESAYQIYAPSRLELDLFNPESVKRFVYNNGINIIIHAAYQKITAKGPVYTESDMCIANLKIFSAIIDCSPYVDMIFYFGSGAEYDRENSVSMVQEEDFGKFIPRDAYGFSKYIMSKMCCEYENVIDLCIFGVYGKYEQWNRRFISNAICRSMFGFPITLEQNVMFDYLYVDDLVRILKIFMTKRLKSRRYNIVRGSGIDLLSLAHCVKKIVNNDVEIIVKQEGWKKDYTACSSKMMEVLESFEFTGVEQAIQEMYCYYEAHRAYITQQKEFESLRG